MKKIYLNCILFLIIIGCTSTPEYQKVVHIQDFPCVRELNKAKAVFEGERLISQLSIADSLFMLITMRDTLFHIYDQNKDHISSFGLRGKGPNEFLRAPIIEDIFHNNSQLFALVYDDLTQKLITIDILESVKSESLVFKKQQELPDSLQGVMDVLYVNDSTLAGVYDDRFHKQNDELRGGFYYYPDKKAFDLFKLINLEINPYEIMPATNINARIPIISPDREKIGILLIHSPVLEVLETGSLQTRQYIIGSAPVKTNFELSSYKEAEIIEYYRSAYAGNKYIYMLRWGHKMDDYLKPSKIQIITWEGEPVCEYLIPAEFELSNIIVDEGKNIFYGMSFSNDKIYEFRYENF